MSYNSPFTGNVVQPTDVSYRAITLSANTQLEWPINGNATDDVAARIMQVTATSGGLSLYMPPANQASVGQDALIRNIGGTTFTVKDYEGVNTIVSIAAGESKYIYITTNANEQGTWGIIAFGVGTSNADSATLAGYGLLASGATLNQSHPTTSLVTGYTFVVADRAQTYVWTGGVATATLPAVSVVGNNWFTLFKNNGSGAVTISASGGQLIDGAVSKTFNPTESAFIICTGTDYITVGYGVSQTFAFNVLNKTVTNGTYVLTASEASNTIQIYQGVLVGNVTIEFPPVSNLYVISNQTTAGGNTLTITTGVIGAATYVVPAGAQATVFCDGTDFYSANTVIVGGAVTSLANGTAGAPSLNFSSETDTGIYRPGAGRFGIAVLGSLIADVSATGLAITGSGNFTTGISGGTF
jgi:hypothetical protein